jgi:hypothetical protein
MALLEIDEEGDRIWIKCGQWKPDLGVELGYALTNVGGDVLDLAVERLKVSAVEGKTRVLREKIVKFSQLLIQEREFEIHIVRKESNDVRGAWWPRKGKNGKGPSAFLEKICVVAA